MISLSILKLHRIESLFVFYLKLFRKKKAVSETAKMSFHRIKKVPANLSYPLPGIMSTL